MLGGLPAQGRVAWCCSTSLCQEGACCCVVLNRKNLVCTALPALCKASPRQSAEARCPRRHVCSLPAWDVSVLLLACLSDHTYHIGFLSPEHQVLAVGGGVSPPDNPHPQQHRACAIRGFVKPFSIN